MSSTFTLDKVLVNAKNLVVRLKEQEGTVDSLLSQSQDLSKKVESMKMVSNICSIVWSFVNTIFKYLTCSQKTDW